MVIESVYNEHSFYPAMLGDLKRANALVIIQSPYLTLQRTEKLEAALADCIKRGIRVCVFVREPEDARKPQKTARNKSFLALVEHLESLGIHVTIRYAIHEKYLIVDEKILYAGSLNILSQYQSSEEMRRWEDASKVRTVIREKRLNECEQCRTEGINMFPTEGDIQQQISIAVREARRRSGLTQSDLALLCNVDQRTISAIETGQRNLSMAKLGKICKMLDVNLHFSPWWATPAVESYIQKRTHEA